MVRRPILVRSGSGISLAPACFFWAFLAFSLSVCTGCDIVANEDEGADGMRGSSQPVEVSVISGEDYSLPGWVRPADFSGYIGHRDLPRPPGSTRIQNWHVSWKDLEPERGVYNWEEVDRVLGLAAAGGYQLNMLLANITYGGGDASRGIVVEQAVPDWVVEEFGLTDRDIINLGWEFDLLIIPGWQVEIREAFNDFVRAFGEQGYPRSQQLATSYILGISPSRGEEFWMTEDSLNLLENNHGFNVTVLDDWISSRFDAYASAFAGVEYKLAWVGKKESWRWVGAGRYMPLAERLVEDAWAMGAGNRSSAIETYNEWLIEPTLGQDVDENGYLVVDESIPSLDSKRFFGDENEEYGEEWVWRFGDMAGEPQRYRFSIFRALQMRMRFLWTSEAAEAINPPLSQYCALSLGKDVTHTPDAWAYLRETPVRAYYCPEGVIRNFERFLVQRDVPGGMTVPTQRNFRAFNAGGNHNSEPDMWYDDLARRTDRTTGNPYIYFDLDDRFNHTGAVQIKVEIFDESNTSWHLDYTNLDHELVSTPSFSNQGDGAIRTVTFKIYDASFLNGLDHSMDFRIDCDGPEDVAVRWVRVVRVDAP